MADQESDDSTTIPTHSENIPNIVFTILNEMDKDEMVAGHFSKLLFHSDSQNHGRHHISDIFRPPQVG